MALEVVNNCDCCEVEYFELENVQDCLEGFQIAGLTADKVYQVALKDSKTVYVREFTADVAGLLTIDSSAFPDRVLNRWGSVYTLEVSGVTFGSQPYTGFKFKIQDSSIGGVYLITQIPNE